MEKRVEAYALKQSLNTQSRASPLVPPAAAAPPEAGSLPLAEAERHRVLVEWNATDMDVPADKCIHELFEAQAGRTPEAVALIFGSGRLSYGELNARANQLAHELRRLGVGPEVLVGIRMGRTERMVIAILAALKAGGAYVPMDPAYPKERTDFILEDARAPVLVTESSLGAVDPPEGTAVVLFDPDWTGTAPAAAENPASGATPGNLAYLIYTSGSTGRPKGVALEHRNTVALVSWARTVYRREELAGVLASTSICFDLSVFEMFVPLCWGGAVILAENALALPGLPMRERVTLVNTVPSAIRELVRMGGIPRSVRVVNLAGEPLLTSLVDGIYAGSAVERVYDLYGPSETTTYSTFALRKAGEPPTIGRPVGNTQIYLLDEKSSPVPVGAIGEMYIGGAGVGRGYLDRPELTAGKFLPNPFVPGGRVYRTGDIARWRADGNLEFLGRMDQQVKIRGYRIELGEIESVLRLEPGVKEAVVLASEGAEGDKRLVAYIVGEARERRLRDFLKVKLPEYMMPAAFVFLGALPLNANGKIDRKALPAPDYSPSREHEFTAPRTTIEKMLAKAWEEILGVSRVGLRDNFFEMGGQSLMATRLVWRLREDLGVEAPLRDLFEHQPLEALAARIEALQAQGEGGGGVRPRIKPIARTANPPLSFAQQRLWFLDQLAPGSSAYNIAQAFRLRGELDRAALEAALAEIVRRHEALRTIFAYEDDGPVQVILPSPAGFALPVTDLCALAGMAREEEAPRLVGEEVLRPFDLGNGPVMRASLLRLGPTDHFLILNVHHIVSDGWSMGALVRELSSLYGAYSQGLPSPLPELPVQYADFAVWQREWLRGDLLDSQLTYWKEQLTGAPFTIDLPADNPAPASRTYRASEVSFQYPEQLTRELNELSHREGATLFMTLLAAFQALLHRLTGQEDILIGTALGGRNQAETEGLIGFFVNTLPVRGTFTGDPTYRALLGQVRERVLGMFAHQDLPFEELVKALNPGRNTSHSPLFQVMFTMDDGLDAEVDLRGVSASPVRAEREAAKFDLTLTLAECEGKLHGWFVYDTDLFEAATIERMAGHLQNLLEGIAASPDQSISLLPLLSDAEKRLMLMDWNATNADYPAGQSVHALFAQQAVRTPEAVAVVDGGTELTYRELDARATRLALRLRAAGAAEGSYVAVCMERSADMITALLAVLKSGAAYVPLEPGIPGERLALILEETGTPVLITQRKLAVTLTNLKPVIVLVDDEQPPTNASAARLPDSATGGSPAYVIYTSGSTGVPKGVIIPHRAISRLVINTDYVQLRSGDVVAQASTCAFDAATFEIWGALLNGAKLVVIGREALLSAKELRAQIESHKISALFLTTALFNYLAREDGAVFRDLTYLLFGGEACDPDSVRLVIDAGPPANLLHVYGPTETTTFATWYRITAVPDRATTIPIGHPIANTRAYLLDGKLNPVPAGVTGELYIGGPGVGECYLNRPEPTAGSFIDNPFEPSGRLYRTGDLARWQPDGNLVFAGRTDHQVKIRGFRIELGEIESVLRMEPGVSDAVAVVREESGSDRRIVAYVVGESRDMALRQFLRSKLPEYMIPAAFVFLDSLPLNANGKVDRKALPAPDYSGSRARGFVAPRTALERQLAKAWEEILGVPEVGSRDNFFEMGGHSLLAIRLIWRLRKELAVELPLRNLFENQTLEALATCIEALQSSGTGAAAILPPIPRAARSGNPPVSFAQQRLWFLDQLAPGSSAYNIPEAFRLRGELNLRALDAAMAEIINRHEALRTIFSYENEKPVQIVLPPGDKFALPVKELRGMDEAAREAEVRRLASEEALEPFDLKKGPLLRALLLQLGAQDHVLLLTIHHIVSDGWSIGILMRELSLLYAALSKGLPSPLAALPVQYADYAVWQRDWLRGQVLDLQMTYWKERLHGDLPALRLAADFPPSSGRTDRAGCRTAEVSKEVCENLGKLCRREGVTMFMLLLAAFNALLNRLTGDEDIVIGSPIAGRNSPETENLMGFFVNTLVLRSDLSGDPGFRQLLGHIREVTLGAYAHQDMPFEKLVEELNPERRLGHTPLFQVMLNMLGAEAGPPKIEGIAVEEMPAGQIESKFDLTLYVSEPGEGLALKLVFNAGLFAQSRMEEMLEQFKYLLAQVAAQPDMRISRISLLTGTARRILPDPALELGVVEYHSIAARLSGLAARFPDKLAVTDPQGSWTYAELESITDYLAGKLWSAGIKRQDVVAVWAGRDASLAIALLGVLKAGAAFVILDPAYPPSRILASLAIARPKGWIDCKLAPGLPPQILQYAEKLSCRLAIPASAPEGSVQFTKRRAEPDNLAYVAFTSGSTGRPKGIAGTERPLSHFLEWHCAKFGLTKEDRFSVLSGLGHDPLLRDILAPLWVGATVCFPEPGLFGNPEQLGKWMKDEEITVAHLTPSMASILADSVEAGGLPSLRRLFFGGDALRNKVIHDIRAAAPSAACVNFYGTTETPQAVACHDLEDAAEYASVAPIGKGIEGVQLLVLNPGGLMAGIGETGEICVRTRYLARGYFDDPDLTSARFVTNRFTNQPGDTVYKTGDLGRYLPDGTVEFLGRNDDQVKIRGYRVETGDVESVLLSHPEVTGAAVVGSEGKDGERRLLAYVACAKEGGVEAGALRELLRQKLPEYMAPSVFVFLRALPLLPNGKVDRKCLPDPDTARPESEKHFVTPRNELELRLLRIWEEVLGVKGIGVRDDFFDLGGHSLLGIRLLSRIEKVFNKRLPLSAIFEARNVELLATVLREEGWTSSWYSLVPIQPCGSRAPLFAIHDLHYKDLAARLGPEQPIYGLRYGLAAHTRDGVAILPPRIEDLAAHYLQEMRGLQPEGPYYLMGLSFGGVVAFEMAQQLHTQQQEVALLALFDSFISPTEHRLPFSDVISNLLTMGPASVFGRLKIRATQLRAKFRRGNYEPHVHHPWGVQRDLARTYSPRTYPGQVILFKASQPAPTVFHRLDPPELGWQKWAAGGCEVHEIFAGHIGLLEEPHVQQVTEILSRSLQPQAPLT